MRASSVTTHIINLLDAHYEDHLTAPEIFERVRVHLPAVNPSTVYRALDRLVGAGKVSVSNMGGSASTYELVRAEIHHHMVCQGCQEIITLDHSEVEAFFSRLEKVHNFKVMTNHLVLFGVCADCHPDEDQ
jgi:Fur family transcriptional regulator, ferric uptake regulator